MNALALLHWLGYLQHFLLVKTEVESLKQMESGPYSHNPSDDLQSATFGPGDLVTQLLAGNGLVTVLRLGLWTYVAAKGHGYRDPFDGSESIVREEKTDLSQTKEEGEVISWHEQFLDELALRKMKKIALIFATVLGLAVDLLYNLPK